MYRSLNFLVELDCPLDDSAPKGLEFTKEFQSRIARERVITKDIDNWRDSGWDFSFEADDEEYSVIVSGLADQNKLLVQISPARAPNALLRMFGVLPSATGDGHDRRRRNADEILATTQHVINVKVAYDRFPQS